VFGFFSDALNLEVITPPWLRFEVLTPVPIVMRAGALIDYRIRIHGLPIRWQTEILEWEPEVRFVDTQRRGPYALWHHTHTFVEEAGGTMCLDEVQYWPRGGALMNRLFVRRDVVRIFEFRSKRLQELFPLRTST
jgi:ligand-binding SRPBCC domain-containing protein